MNSYFDDLRNKFKEIAIFEDNFMNKSIKYVLWKSINFIFNNLVAVFTACSFIVGGLLLLGYFIHINFMPDLPSPTTLIYVMASLGSFFIISIMYQIMLPGLFLNFSLNFINKNYTINKDVRLIKIPFLMLIIAMFVLISFTAALYSYQNSYICFVFFIILCFVLLIWASYKCVRLGHSNTSTPKKCFWTHPAKWRVHGLYFATIFVLALICAFPLNFVLTSHLQRNIKSLSDWQGFSFIIFLIIITTFLNSLIVAMNLKKLDGLILFLITTLIMLFFILYFTGSFSLIPVTIVRIVGLGEIDDARLSISSKGCTAVNQTTGKIICHKESNDQPSLICHAVIRSRIGSQVLLEFTQSMLNFNEKSQTAECQTLPKDSDKKVEVRVVIGKSDLLAWQKL